MSCKAAGREVYKTMALIPIDSLDDPRLQPFRDVKAMNNVRSGDYFIVEGRKTVERLLASRFETLSLLLTEKRVDDFGAMVPADIPTYVVPQQLGCDLVGFNFHVGVMACGRRRVSATVSDLLANLSAKSTMTFAICPNCDNPENLGAIVRISAGFGVDAVILGRGSCDPFSRRVIRVSMGAAFKIPILETETLEDDLKLMRSQGVELAATILDPGAESMRHATRSSRFGLLFGNEATGLDERWIGLCDRRLTIPMSGETDSLNVAIAAGIFLHHFAIDEESAAGAPAK